MNFVYKVQIKFESELWVEFKKILVKCPPGSYPKTNQEYIKVLTSANLFTSGFKKFFNFFKGFLKEEEFLNGSGKNIFFCGPILSYRIFSKSFYFLRRNGRFFPFLIALAEGNFSRSFRVEVL